MRVTRDESLEVIAKFIIDNFPKPITHVLKKVNRFLFNTLQKNLDSYDLIHLTVPHNYYSFTECSRGMMLTVHDLCCFITPEFVKEKNRLATSAGLEFIAEQKGYIISVSQSSFDDFQQHFEGFPKETEK